MSQVRKYQSGGTTPEKEKTKSFIPGLEEVTLKEPANKTNVNEIPKSYFILDGEKFENNDANRQYFKNYLASLVETPGDSPWFSQMSDLVDQAATTGGNIEFKTGEGTIDFNGQKIKWDTLNEQQNERIQKPRTWLGRVLDAASNNKVQRMAEDIHKISGFKDYLKAQLAKNQSETVNPDLLNIDYNNGWFDYLKDSDGKFLKDDNGNLKYDTYSTTNQNLMRSLNRMNTYLGLTDDFKKNQFNLGEGWRTDNRFENLKEIYNSNPELWKQQYSNITSKVAAGQQLANEELSWLKLFGITPENAIKTPEDIATEKAIKLQNAWTNAGYGNIYEKGKDWFILGDDGLLSITDAGNEALKSILLSSTGNEFNNEFLNYIKNPELNLNPLNYDFLNGYTLYNGKLYKTDSGTDSNSALGKIYSTSGFIDKNKANQYADAQKIINTFWGNPYEWSRAEDGYYSNFLWDPDANNSTGGYRTGRRYRSENGRYSGLKPGQQIVSYYDSDAERDYKGYVTDEGIRYAITDEYGDVVVEGLTKDELSKYAQFAKDDQEREIPYGIEDNAFRQRKLFKSQDSRINNHTVISTGLDNEYGLYYNPIKPISNTNDPESAVIYTDNSMDAAYVVPATLANILTTKTENGSTYFDVILANRNLQDKFRRLLTAFSDVKLGSIKQWLTVGSTTIWNLCKEIGREDLYDTIKDEWVSMMQKPNKNSLYVINKSNIPNNQIESHKQGGIIRKFAPGGGFAKTTRTKGKTENNNIKIRDSRELGTASEMLSFDWNKLPTHDKAEILGLGADVAALAMTFIPGVGNLAAAGTGLAGTTAGLVADVRRDGFQMKDLGNFGINALMDLGAALPGIGTASKLAGTLNKARKVAPLLLKIASAYGLTQVVPIAKRLIAGEDVSIRDLRSLVNGITAGVNLSKTGIKNGTKKTKTTEDVTLTGTKSEQAKGFEIKSKTGKPEDSIFLTKEEVDQLNSISDIKQKNLKYGELVASKKGVKPTDTNFGETITSYDHVGSGVGKLNSEGILEVGRLSMPRATKVSASKITFKKADIEKINAGKTPEAKEKALVDIVKKQPGNEDLDSIEKVREIYDLDNFYKDKRQRSWSLNPKKSIIGEKVTQFQGIPNKSTITDIPIEPSGNKLKDWFNGAGDKQSAIRAAIKGEGSANTPKIKTGVYEDIITVPGDGINPRNLPVIPQHTLREQVKISPNWQKAYDYITKKGLGRMHIISPVSNLPTHKAVPGVIIEDENNTFAYKEGGNIPKLSTGWTTLPTLKDKIKNGLQKVDPANVAEFGKFIINVANNNKVKNIAKKGFDNIPTILAPTYNTPRFNDEGLLNSGRDLIKNIYNRTPVNYTSDAMLNNFIRKANQEKATEYQNNLNTALSQQIAKHNAKVFEIEQQNNANQIQATNQNRQNAFNRQQSLANIDAATVIGNNQSITNLLTDRVLKLGEQRRAAQAAKASMSAYYNNAKLQDLLKNKSGYQAAMSKFNAYKSMHPMATFEEWISDNSAYYVPYIEDLTQAQNKIGFDSLGENINNFGPYSYIPRNYYNQMITNAKGTGLYKKGGKVSNKNHRDAREQIWIDDNKEIRKAIQQLNKNTQQLLLKMLK